MIFLIDFDGTCVSHKFPDTGKDIGAAEVLLELVEEGHRLIAWTVRADMIVVIEVEDGLKEIAGKHLSNAVEWFNKNNIPLYGINETPGQKSWSASPKAYGHHYIGDDALGCPLIYESGERPYVDWKAMRELLVKIGALKPKKNGEE